MQINIKSNNHDQIVGNLYDKKGGLSCKAGPVLLKPAALRNAAVAVMMKHYY